MDNSENGNLLLEQYGRFKRMELEKSPFHFLLANESHIDPNPHQINAFCAAIDAMKTGGMVLADEVGLGKTIEAGLVLRYMLESGAKTVLIALPASLRKQWELELEEKFDLKPVIWTGSQSSMTRTTGTGNSPTGRASGSSSHPTTIRGS